MIEDVDITKAAQAFIQLDTSKNHPPSPATRLIIAEYGGWQGMVDGLKGVFRDAQLQTEFNLPAIGQIGFVIRDMALDHKIYILVCRNGFLGLADSHHT